MCIAYLKNINTNKRELIDNGELLKMIIEIHDMPNNQILKSLDIHIDFENTENSSCNCITVSNEKKDKKTIDIKNEKADTIQQGIDEMTEEEMISAEIPKEMTDATF